MGNRSRVRISGPLAAYADAFAAELSRLGYAAGSASHLLRLLAHLSGWLEQRGSGTTLGRADLVRFVAERRADGRRPHVSMRGVAPLIYFLDEVGVLAAEEVQAPTGVEQFIDRYRGYLRRERGVVGSSAHTYVSALRPFLERRAVEGRVDLEGLTAAEETGFLLEVSALGMPGRAQTTATALRSLLRSLHLEGITERPLAGAVPMAADHERRGPRSSPGGR